MKRYQETDWTFLNMNSPADLYADYQREWVDLQEYDRCRDGHALVSRFYVDKDHVFFQTAISKTDAGAGIGLYFGDGCYSKYCLAVVKDNEVTVRVPNGVPQGDTFRLDGPKRYYEAARAPIACQGEFTLGFQMKRGCITVYFNNRVVIDSQLLPFPFDTGGLPARLMVKALNENGRSPVAGTRFGGYRAEGILEPAMLTGICREDGAAAKDVYLHIAEDFNKWAKTDRNGYFSIPDVPAGTYTLVCGMEGREFTSCQVEQKGATIELDLKFPEAMEREAEPQEHLQTSLPYQGLNGLWRFDFDPEDQGEAQQWYCPQSHVYTKCIRVPFSWQSLMAFGEEALADSYSLHQANAFTCAWRELGETGWYQRTVQVNWDDPQRETELVFAAVSGVSVVWLDDRRLGSVLDSYNQQIFRLGRLVPGKSYTLTVKVNYQHGNNWACSGKQGFWFTDAPGIWQNVWLREGRAVEVSDILVQTRKKSEAEWELTVQTNFRQYCPPLLDLDLTEMPQAGFRVEQEGRYQIRIAYRTAAECRAILLVDQQKTDIVLVFEAVPQGSYCDYAVCCLELPAGIHELEWVSESGALELLSMSIGKADWEFQAELYFDDEMIAVLKPEPSPDTGLPESQICYRLKEPQLWSPEDPWQYRLAVRMNGENEAEYCRSLGIREVSAVSGKMENSQYMALNGQPVYVRGVLDQGYNPWGLYTYRTIHSGQPGSPAFDIQAAAACGYNLMRMHIKDNEPEWYAACDRLGMLVWDEHPSNFYGTSDDPHWQSMYRRQLRRMVRKHNYHAAVVISSVINESWGISGDHEMSPWEDPHAQQLIKGYAGYYRKHANQVLVVDNSGYGKTEAAELIDHHSYPDGYEDARQFFGRLAKQNYPGSVFNFFHQDNRRLMQAEEIRDLLQRTCRQDLKELDYAGQEQQNGQPVLISEFVHTDKQEELVRIYPEFAGYVRMNIASQENEDTSPLTAARVWRDFGLVDENFNTMPYGMMNQEDLLFLDYPLLTKVQAGAELEIPVFLSLWNRALPEGGEITLEWQLTGIDQRGNYRETGLRGSWNGSIIRESPYSFGSICFRIPAGWKGGYLFACLKYQEQVVSRNYLQLEIFYGDGEPDGFHTLELLPEHLTGKKEFLYTGEYNRDGRHLVWGYGRGEMTYQIPVTQNYAGMAELILELSPCHYPEGTRETDAAMEPGRVEIFVQDQLIYQGELPGQPCDRRGLFSNSSAGREAISKYRETGIYGYGYRIKAGIPADVLAQIQQQAAAAVKVKAVDKGLIIYGNRMGRYGCNPMIEFAPDAGKETQHDE